MVPAVRVSPKLSSGSALLPSPGLFWVNSCPPALESPPAEPYSTLTAPASGMVPTVSNGAPAARSPKPSWSKSPAASASPKKSCSSAAPPTWVNSRPLARVNPAEEP
jgi:hypothetical protein